MLSLGSVALGYAPAMRPVGQQRAAVQMQEAEYAAGQPDAISTNGGYVDAPTALKDELGAIGPLGYWDPLGMVRIPTRQSPVCCRAALQRCRIACTLELEPSSLCEPAPLCASASAVWFHSRRASRVAVPGAAREVPALEGS